MKDVIVVLEKDGVVLDRRELKNDVFYFGKAFLMRELLLGDIRQTRWYVQIGRDNRYIDPIEKMASLYEPIAEERIYFLDEKWRPDVKLDLAEAKIEIHKTFSFREPIGPVGEAGIVIEKGDTRYLLNRVIFRPPIYVVDRTTLSFYFIIKFI